MPLAELGLWTECEHAEEALASRWHQPEGSRSGISPESGELCAGEDKGEKKGDGRGKDGTGYRDGETEKS